MKLKKHIRFKDGNQVWRILISPTGKLVIETRNPEKKEAYFSCIDLQSSKKIFKSFQFDDKYWIGIEDIYNDTILLHRFSKPDMPGHKSIIAFDVNNKSILWQNNEYAFLFLYQKKIYAYRQQFEGRQFFTLDPLTGELLDELGNDQLKMNELKYKADESRDFSKYIFPQPIELSESNEIVKDVCRDFDVSGDVEFLKVRNFLIFNFHSRAINNFLENRFFIYDLVKKKIVIKEILNSAVLSVVPDSFFVYDNYVIVLKDKSETLVYKME